MWRSRRDCRRARSTAARRPTPTSSRRRGRAWRRSTTTATGGSTSSSSTARTLEGFPKGQEPTNHLYRNRGNGTFEDVTVRAGLARERLGTGRVRRRLRQRRPRRPVRHLLGPEPALPQPGRRHLRGRHAPRRRRQRPHALELGLRLSRLRPRRSARPLRRQLHRPRSLRHAAPLLGPVPVQGPRGRVRPAGTARRQEPALSQSRRRHVRRRVGDVGHHARERHLRPRRRHARLRRRWLDRHLRRQRLEPERALPQQQERHLHRHRDGCGVRLQPGRQGTGRHGRRRSATTTATARWTSSRRTSPATRRRSTRTPARASARTAPSPPASASTRAGSAGA